jgi:hypothetical protein
MDCNVATAPDTDGCECDTATTAAQGTVNGCCGTGCQTKHSNGLMQNFFDCQPLGTIDQPQATEACTVFTGDVTKCHAFACTGPGSNQVVCSDTAATCACWGFAGTNAGHVHANATTTCNCASAADSPWN